VPVNAALLARGDDRSQNPQFHHANLDRERR
jgi:hypothetical protein